MSGNADIANSLKVVFLLMAGLVRLLGLMQCFTGVIDHFNAHIEALSQTGGYDAEILKKLETALASYRLLQFAVDREFTSIRRIRIRPLSLRPIEQTALVFTLPAGGSFLLIQKSRLALRQLAAATVNMRDGLGPLPAPSGAGSSTIRLSTPSRSKATLKR